MRHWDLTAVWARAGAHMMSRNSQDGAVRRIVMGVWVLQAQFAPRMHILIGGTAWYNRDYVDDMGWIQIHFGGTRVRIYAFYGVVKLSIAES